MNGSHELVKRANYETIYSDMPPFGLAKATERISRPWAGGRRRGGA
jgi:hypothetical protein